jgi:hypothetical protein
MFTDIDFVILPGMGPRRLGPLGSQTGVIAMAAPGYSNIANWSTYANCLQFCQQLVADIPTVTHIAIQENFTYTGPNSWIGVTLDSSTALSDAQFTNMATAILAVGRGLILKPHGVMGDGTTQFLWLPGSKTSRAQNYTNASPGDGHYTNGALGFSSVGMAAAALPLVNSAQTAGGDVGKRIVTPASGHTSEIPNSGYSNYGLGNPAFTTVATVTAGGTGTLSGNAGTTSTTGTFYVLFDDNANPATAPAWNLAMPVFAAWEGVLDHRLSLATGVGFTASNIIVNMSTEHDWCTRYYPNAWAWISTTLKAKYAGLRSFVQAAEGLTYRSDCPTILQSVCDFIGISCYPVVGSATSGLPQATIDAGWATALGSGVTAMSAWATAIGLPMIFGEVGARSIPHAYSYGSNSSFIQGVDPAADQASFYQGMMNNCWGRSWWGGYCVWTGYFIYPYPTAQDPGSTAGTQNYIEGGGSGNNGSYAPKDLAQAVLAAY